MSEKCPVCGKPLVKSPVGVGYLCDNTICCLSGLSARRHTYSDSRRMCMLMTDDILALARATRAREIEAAIEPWRDKLTWIAQQFCRHDAKGSCEGTDSQPEVLCSETGSDVTEWCLSCYARAALGWTAENYRARLVTSIPSAPVCEMCHNDLRYCAIPDSCPMQNDGDECTMADVAICPSHKPCPDCSAPGEGRGRE